MSVKTILTPEIFSQSLKNGLSVEAVVKGICSRSRGYQLLKEYERDHPELFPKKKTITKEELSRQLERSTLQETAQFFSVSVNTLKSRMKQFGLKKRTIKNILTPEVVQELVKTKSDQEIADEFHCSIHTVMKIRYDHHIYRRKERRD
ncbi:hypothetical protein JK635_07950 [Neobacillus sp. YIM B02564]|uniref:Transposase Synechocystis PCC 6803 domain-containing protein n=1 Tax=Neobacillus paridis TaxID=2803862 RepID=A0ABS1TLT8_9BACI|nr:hypothetical protein [Neobacillus paridis]MBL4952143.1 hypothetical protein [Neobacillus paridis]